MSPVVASRGWFQQPLVLIPAAALAVGAAAIALTASTGLWPDAGNTDDELAAALEPTASASASAPPPTEPPPTATPTPSLVPPPSLPPPSPVATAVEVVTAAPTDTAPTDEGIVDTAPADGVAVDEAPAATESRPGDVIRDPAGAPAPAPARPEFTCDMPITNTGFGADPALDTAPPRQQEAREAARNLDITAPSRPQLVAALENQRFSTEDANCAADGVPDIDWNYYAAGSAGSAASTRNITDPAELTQYLLDEGFTPEQAAYGVSQALP
ncbi:hypothetical protein [Aquipuribacter sp. MA13-6]|uniref:hypothetical protein n=1 Tax=unclassified Aquipuribacter TaxID=2635084 RepID=UPI003EE93151